MQKSGQYLFLDLKENERKESLVCSQMCLFLTGEAKSEPGTGGRRRGTLEQ